MENYSNQLHYLFENKKLLVFTKGQVWFDKQLLDTYSLWVKNDQSSLDLLANHSDSVDDIICLKNVYIWAMLNGYESIE
jgi:hypothetical protein